MTGLQDCLSSQAGAPWLGCRRPERGSFSGFAKGGAYEVRTHVFFQLVPF